MLSLRRQREREVKELVLENPLLYGKKGEMGEGAGRCRQVVRFGSENLEAFILF